MATKILLKKSLTGGSVPVSGDIDAGEIAINLVDRKIYSKNGSGAVIRMDGAYVDSTSPANPVEGDIWYDTANNLLKAHNGTGFISAGYATIAALEDTTITSVTDGEFLIYDNATSKWINGTHAEADVQKVSTLEADVEALFSVTNASGDGSLAYSAGVFTYTGPSAAETRAHFTGGTGIDITAGDVSVDFTEFDLDSISEASSNPTNKYFTDARARAAVSATDAGGDGSFSYDASTGAFTYTGPSAAETQAHFTGGNGISLTGGEFALDFTEFDTSDITEVTNLFFTDARARAAVSVTDAGGDGSLSYNSTTGVITYTGPSASEVQAHITGGTGVTITSGSVAIGQAVATTDSVTFANVTVPTIDGNGTTLTLDPSADGSNGGTVIIAGDLTVNGTTTSVNSNEVNIGDAIIVLNADETGTPSQDAGIEVERGTATNKVLKWNETDDAWDLGGETMQNIILDGGSY
jgi:hypothetical protein